MTPTFTVPAEALADALAVINTAVEKKNTIPVLGFLLLEGEEQVTVTGTDLDTTVRLAVAGEGKGVFCVPAAQLREFAGLANGTIALTEAREPRAIARAVVSCDGFTSRLPLLEKADFPQCPSVIGIGIKLSGSVLASALKMVVLAADKVDYGKRWATKSVNIKLSGGNLTLASTDEGQLAVAMIPVDSADEAEYLVPRQSITALMAFANASEQVELAETNNHFGLISPSGSVVARLLVGKFPEWRNFLPIQYPHTVTTNCEGLLLALRRAALGLDDRDVSTRWTVSRELLTISARSPEREGEGTLGIDCSTLNGDNLALGLNGPTVLRFLAAVEGDVRFSFIDAVSPYRFEVDTEGFTYQYLTMGMKPDMY